MKKNEENIFGMFDLNDFKKWINNHEEDKSKNSIVGIQIESKIPLKKLTGRIFEVEKGDKNQVAKDFFNEGGKILEVDGHNFLVEVSSGVFYIHRMYTKKSD